LCLFQHKHYFNRTDRVKAKVGQRKARGRTALTNAYIGVLHALQVCRPHKLTYSDITASICTHTDHYYSISGIFWIFLLPGEMRWTDTLHATDN